MNEDIQGTAGDFGCASRGGLAHNQRQHKNTGCNNITFSAT